MTRMYTVCVCVCACVRVCVLYKDGIDQKLPLVCQCVFTSKSSQVERTATGGSDGKGLQVCECLLVCLQSFESGYCVMCNLSSILK